MRFFIPFLFFSWILASIALTETVAQVSELDWSLEIVSEGHGFTEGASLGPDGKIYFSDMDKQKILRYDPTSGITTVWQEESGKTNGLFILGSKLFGCEAGGRAVVEYDLDKGPGSRKVLASEFQSDKLGCPNDITIIGDVLYFSEFWIPSFHKESGEKQEIFRNRVYAYSLKNRSLDSLDFNFEIPNGVASSPDGKLLFIGDIQANKLYRARLENGKAGPLEVFVDLDKLGLKGPDGMTIAADGRIYLALYRSDKLLVLNPDGSPIGYLPTGPMTTNCIFAADGKTLYITADQKLKRVIVPPEPWKQVLKDDLNLLGHRNWILVVDKAFPEQSSPGMKYMYVDQELLPTLRYVLGQVEASSHVSPIIYMDKELSFITEDQVKGIGAFRAESEAILEGRNVNTMLHDEVFKMLDESSSLFRTLVIKTNCTMPYTSVFLQLDCAYWGPENEQLLRQKMLKSTL